MANLIAQPDKWKGTSGETPPNTWDGHKYVWDAATSPGYGGPNVYLRLSASGTDTGDTVEFTVNVSGLTSYGVPIDPVYLVINHNGSAPQEHVYELASDASIDITADAFPSMQITVSSSPDMAYGIYDAGSVTFTPSGSTPPGPEPATSYNCACDDDYPRATLAEMRNRLARRLGYSVQVAMGALPPGMSDLLDDFIRQAQEVLYRRYSVFRMERWYTWDLVAGTRFYDLDANADACTKKLDPRKVTWCGISQGDDSWRPLVCGINPTMYTSQGPGIPSHYEIRQCIEVWPSPSDDTWKLRAKGYFGLQPLVADTDETTIDPEAIFLFALANAKAHYGQPDANNYASMATAYVRDLVRGQHHTRRYVPGECEPPPMVRPVPVGGWE